MKHTKSFKKIETKKEGINFLTALGYTENAKTELQQLGYTDGSLQFTKGEYYASVSPDLHSNMFYILY